jgi:16S rRNA (guanine966-N2)-methyltransferase
LIRITAGDLRGRRIAVPKDDVRPTSERARQAYFNIVGPRIHEARFLDLFAGSGIFAFEAVSRGAREAVAIDSGRAHTAAIGKTAQQLEVPVTTLTTDVLTSLARIGGPPFELVYADPPYGWEKYDELLTAMDTELSLAPDALVAIEHRRGTEPFQATLTKLKHTRRAEYGEVWISFFIYEAA